MIEKNVSEEFSEIKKEDFQKGVLRVTKTCLIRAFQKMRFICFRQIYVFKDYYILDICYGQVLTV